MKNLKMSRKTVWVSPLGDPQKSIDFKNNELLIAIKEQKNEFKEQSKRKRN